MSRQKSSEPHRKPIQVKLTGDERDTLDAAAARAGLQTSTWMRMVALEAANRPTLPARRR